MQSDAIGLWRILETDTFHDEPQTCGGTIPNSNVENLKLGGYRQYLEDHYGSLRERVLELVDERYHRRGEVPPRNQWRYLGVRDPSSREDFIGVWTMVYDEGLDIQVGNTRYFGYFKYSHVDSQDCPMVMDGSQADSNGHVACYKTKASEIGLGWATKKVYKNGKTNHMYGCFYAEKIKKDNMHSYVLDESATVNIGKANPSSGLWERKAYSQFTDLSPFRFLQLHKGVSFRSLHHTRMSNDPTASNRMVTRFMQKGEVLCVNRHIVEGETNYHACKVAYNGTDYYKELSLPSHWSWGDAFQGDNDNIQPFSQGQCGSCYAMASIYVFAKRFEILLRKLYPQHRWDDLPRPSVQDIVECSPFGQGCFGGFPFLVGKHLCEQGVLSESESSYKMYHESSTPTCSVKSGIPGGKWYASSYGYVGGCYECTNEFEIMKEVYHHGPVAVAIDAPQTLFDYNNGIYDDTPTNHGSTCDLPHSGLNGWEYTNHAIAIVGWGEEEVRGQLTKYWICRNTWGNSWGVEGFFKIKRGVNQCGVESQAVFIDPDLTRGIPEQLIRERAR
ncbi:putative preprocathepsin c precursor [Babesia divergens]|uniref:Dipeptidyl peptidase 1 n=1 Tax=Babesia divergens TaxID=32595 RepID=A0AAD9LKD0_BABDI|nr:putative preprocathepsin c precursor [Babesia divergens]